MISPVIEFIVSRFFSNRLIYRILKVQQKEKQFDYLFRSTSLPTDIVPIVGLNQSQGHNRKKKKKKKKVDLLLRVYLARNLAVSLDIIVSAILQILYIEWF